MFFFLCMSSIISMFSVTKNETFSPPPLSYYFPQSSAWTVDPATLHFALRGSDDNINAIWDFKI